MLDSKNEHLEVKVVTNKTHFLKCQDAAVQQVIFNIMELWAASRCSQFLKIIFETKRHPSLSYPEFHCFFFQWPYLILFLKNIEVTVKWVIPVSSAVCEIVMKKLILFLAFIDR